MINLIILQNEYTIPNIDEFQSTYYVWISESVRRYNSDTLALGIHFDCLEKAALVPVKPPQAKKKMERLHQQEA